MEPDDLKSAPPDDPALDAWLRANASLPPLPDDGFSQRVLTALPSAPRSARRLWLCAAGALAGTGVASFKLLQAGGLPALAQSLHAAAGQLATPTVGLALGVSLISLAYVFWSDLRRFVPL
ncbi:MAG: hypothetical protein HYV95_16570 [Opitutae bacterium]|nr:hypothetical protein [Opitutae bacterium]